jgi:hypothetical protein
MPVIFGILRHSSFPAVNMLRVRITTELESLGDSFRPFESQGLDANADPSTTSKVRQASGVNGVAGPSLRSLCSSLSTCRPQLTRQGEPYVLRAFQVRTALLNSYGEAFPCQSMEVMARCVCSELWILLMQKFQ